MTVAELEELLLAASSVYYYGEYKGVKYDHPLMSDATFDQYVEWLRTMRPNSRVFQSTGWGASPENVQGNKISHKHGGMESIDRKPRDIKDIPADLRSNVRLSAKLDGLSAVMHFEGGQLVYAATRGNGTAGLDKTDKFRALLQRYGGTKLPDNFDGEIRGELVISVANWDKMVAAGTTKKNWRNAASGIVRADEITDEFKYIDFVPYKVIWDRNHIFSNKVLDDMNDCEFCKYLPGFPSIPFCMRKEGFGLQDLEDAYNAFALIYPIDGVVITSNDIKVNEDGTREYNECAFKFESLKKQTTIESITWQPTKSQILAPVANVTPVEIDGSVISNVTLHNAKNVIAIGAVPGAVVEIMKSGEVIPAITQVVTPVEFEPAEVLPNVCPVCGGEIEWRGVHIACSNPCCGNIARQDLRSWVQHIAPTAGLADTLIFQYFERFHIECIDDLYRSPLFESTKNAVANEGKHSSLFVQMYNRLQAAPVDLTQALLATNITRLGPVMAEKLACDKTFQQLLADQLAADRFIGEAYYWKDCIYRVLGEGNGAAVLSLIYKLSTLKYLRNRIIYPSTDNVAAADLIPVCITGKLSMPRKQFEDLLKAHGYVVKEDVSKKVMYLITNEPSGSSSKHKQADALGTRKVSEEEMLRILEK